VKQKKFDLTRKGLPPPPPEGEHIQLDEQDLVAIGKDAQQAKKGGAIEYALCDAAGRCAFAKFIKYSFGLRTDWHGNLVAGCYVYAANGYSTSSIRFRPDSPAFELGRTYILALTHKVVIPSPDYPGAWKLFLGAVILRGFLTGREIAALNDEKVVALSGDGLKRIDERGRPVFYARKLQVPLNMPQIIDHLHWHAA
jgi:hypothetical protein